MKQVNWPETLVDPILAGSCTSVTFTVVVAGTDGGRGQRAVEKDCTGNSIQHYVHAYSLVCLAIRSSPVAFILWVSSRLDEMCVSD